MVRLLVGAPCTPDKLGSSGGILRDQDRVREGQLDPAVAPKQAAIMGSPRDGGTPGQSHLVACPSQPFDDHSDSSQALLKG